MVLGKNKFWIVLSVATAVAVLNSPCAFAELSDHAPSYEVLEFSLMGLKESASQVSANNEALIVQNESLRQEIQQLKGELDELMQAKGKLLAGSKQTHHTVKIDKKEMIILHNHLKQLQAKIVFLEDEHKRLQEQMEVKKADSQSINEEIIKMTQEIEEIRNTQARFDQNNSDSEGKRLLKMKQESQMNLANLEKKIKALQVKPAKPSKVYDGIKEEYYRLKQGKILLEDQMQEAASDGKRIRAEIEQIEKNKTQDSVQLDGDIAALQARHQELEKILAESATQAKQNNLDALDYKQKNEQLEEDLVILRRENQILRNKLDLLKKEIGVSEEK